MKNGSVVHQTGISDGRNVIQSQKTRRDVLTLEKK